MKKHLLNATFLGLSFIAFSASAALPVEVGTQFTALGADVVELTALVMTGAIALAAGFKIVRLVRRGIGSM